MNPQYYLALLRGINVGGNNIIKMERLKACFEEMGFRDVRTYIQSGNVLFRASGKQTEALVKRIEKVLSERFNYLSRIVVVTESQLKYVVENAPLDFGRSPAEYRYDVIFLKKPLTARVAIKSVSAKEGVDAAYVGVGVLYFSRLIKKAAQSHLSKLIQQPVYKSMTIRNWNTTTRLLALMESN
jgi:uncharacterized protein (DUF1697 family)